MAISTAPDGGFHRESMCTQTEPTYISHNMLREVKVQIARWHQGGYPHSADKCVNQLKGLEGGQTKNDK